MRVQLQERRQNVADTSRAEYFRERRKKMKQVVFMIDKERGEALDTKLREQHLGRTEWFKRVIDEYIGKK